MGEFPQVSLDTLGFVVLAGRDRGRLHQRKGQAVAQAAFAAVQGVSDRLAGSSLQLDVTRAPVLLRTTAVYVRFDAKATPEDSISRSRFHAALP
jgi:hypothetical protein